MIERTMLRDGREQQTADRPTRRELNAIYRCDFSAFVEGALNVVEPGTRFIPAPYIDALCHELTEVAAGKVNRLIVNMAPRHLKSFIISGAWPAWLLLRNPSSKIAVISHNDNLAVDLALKRRRLVESAWYRVLAPNVRICRDRNRTKDFETTAHGGVFASSMSAGVTGRGFDAIILDDPQAASSAQSAAERENTKLLFDEMLTSRLDDQVHGVIVVVQQRLHEDDLSGYLISRGGWKLLSLPLVATQPQVYATAKGEWHRVPGDVLCPERIPPEEIENLRARLGPQVFETQYQQAPSSFSGELIRPEQLRSIPAVPASANRYFVSVDTANLATAMANYTVFIVCATDGTRHYVVDVIRGRFQVNEMRDISIRLFSKYKLEKFLVEQSASGPSLVSLLRETGHAARLIAATKDKTSRLQDCIHLFAEGRIFLVGDAPWVTTFRDELVRFPIAKFDDQVDALTLYLSQITATVRVRPVILGTNSSAERAIQKLLGSRPLRDGGHPMRPRNGRGLPRRFF